MLKRGKRSAAGLLMRLLGLCCALALGTAFYAAMAYQLAGEPRGEAARARPAGRLALSEGTLLSQTQENVAFGAQTCTALVRVYALAGGAQAEAITAEPAAYLERMSREGWQPQLITGFVLAGLDAVYATRGEESLLAARDGDRAYMLRAAADEQTVYALGASASLEE